ncbi:MAG: hypothetical protein Q9169_004228 [Polycauliona sp. 2 TL-2023]
MDLNVKGRAISYAEPALFLCVALYGAILAVFDILFRQRRPQDLLNPSKFSDHAFGIFWLLMAPQLAEKEVEKGVPALVASAKGTIIEIGPGSGNQVSRYDRSKVTKIYGIEPTASLHPKLRENIKKAGLSDVYTIVPCGVQDVEMLRRYGVDKEAFDTVLSVQVFCSVPNPKEMAAALWGLLKPGGTMIVYEHVKSRDFISSKVQDFYNIIWPCRTEAQERAVYTPYLNVHSESNGNSPLQVQLIQNAFAKTPDLMQITDIDEKNLSYARQNIQANHLESRIRPLLTSSSDPLIPLDALCLDNITFTICNPPFYSSPSDLLSSAAAKSRPPHSTCTGSPIEMVTPGGEVAFVTRIIKESEQLRERCQWYTTMLGKYSSLGVVVEELKTRGVVNWAVKEFVQGGKTRRWGVGWSWVMRRPREDVARGVSNSIPKHLLPFPSQFKFEIPNASIDLVGSRICMLLENLDLQWQYRAQISTGVGFARANVWSRAARRQQQREAGSGGMLTKESDQDDDEEVEKAALGFKIQLAREGEAIAVSIRWLQGADCVLFESFCGMVKRRVGS